MSKKKEKSERISLSTTKKIVYFCLINGMAWVWCSYILAFIGKDVIAETLSQVALTEIIAVVLVYALKSLFENLSMHNLWPDKQVAGDVEIGGDIAVDGDVTTMDDYSVTDPDNCYDL